MCTCFRTRFKQWMTEIFYKSLPSMTFTPVLYTSTIGKLYWMCFSGGSYGPSAPPVPMPVMPALVIQQDVFQGISRHTVLGLVLHLIQLLVCHCSHPKLSSLLPCSHTDYLNGLLINFVAKHLGSGLIASLVNWLHLRPNYDYLHKIKNCNNVGGALYLFP